MGPTKDHDHNAQSGDYVVRGNTVHYSSNGSNYYGVARGNTMTHYGSNGSVTATSIKRGNRIVIYDSNGRYVSTWMNGTCISNCPPKR